MPGCRRRQSPSRGALVEPKKASVAVDVLALQDSPDQSVHYRTKEEKEEVEKKLKARRRRIQTLQGKLYAENERGS